MKTRKIESIEKVLDKTMRGTRLGTCYNAITRDIDIRQVAFDLSLLNGAKGLMFVPGRGLFEFTADSNICSEENSSCWGGSASTSVGMSKCSRVAASFKMEHSKAEARNSSEIKACVSYRYLDSFMQILKADEDTYINCLKSHCKKKLKAILECSDAKERFKKYRDFRKEFGTGCVTTLYLGAGSIARMTIKVEGSAISTKHKYEGKATVAYKGVNVETEGGWAGEYKKAGLEGNIKIIAWDYPPDSPTSDWVHKLVQQFNDVGIEQISKQQAWANLPEVNFKSEDPFRDLESEKPKEEEHKKVDKNITDELKKEILEDENFPGTWEEFKEKQKRLWDEIDKNKIVKETNKKVENPEKHEKMREERLAAVSQSNVTVKEKTGAQLVESGSDYNLGDYQPVDFEVTNWEELFPSLKGITRPPSTSNINFAKIMTYYYTRLQFGQYMQFLKDVYDNLDPISIEGKAIRNPRLNNDITVYYDHCDKYLKDFNERSFEEAKDGLLKEEDYLYWINAFEVGLLNRRKLKFFNKEIYNIFFRNYDMFSKCPYGFIIHCIIRSPSYPRPKIEPDPDKVLILEKDFFHSGKRLKSAEYKGLFNELEERERSRLYPAILTRAEESDIWLIHFEDGRAKAPLGGYIRAPSGESCRIGQCYYDDYRNKWTKYSAELAYCGNGFVCTRVSDPLDVWESQRAGVLECVGFDDVKKEKPIIGATPMFRDFPFDDAKFFPG